MVDVGEGGADNGEDIILRKANELVRLALFTELNRGYLKRDDINKKGRCLKSSHIQGAESWS